MQKAEAQREDGESFVPLEPCGQFGRENQVSQNRRGAKGSEGQQSSPHDGGQAEDLGVGDLGEHRSGLGGVVAI